MWYSKQYMTKYSLLALIVFVIGCFISIFIPLFFVRNNTPDALKTRLEMIPMYLGPVMAFVSALLFVDSLVQQHRSYTLQQEEYKRNNFNISFERVNSDLADYIDSLEMPCRYNKYSTESTILRKYEVIDELTIFLKKGNCARGYINESDIKDTDVVHKETNAWFTTVINEIYFSEGSFYKCFERPQRECDYLNNIERRLHSMIKLFFDLLENAPVQDIQYEKEIFASYFSKDLFEAFLTTREKKQDIPNESLFFDILNLSRAY